MTWQLLLFWMDPSSSVFLGNGAELLQHVLDHPTSFRHLPHTTTQPFTYVAHTYICT